MAGNGTKTSDLPIVAALNELIGNGPDGTARLSMREFARQLATDRDLQISLANALGDGPDLGALAALDAVGEPDISDDAVSEQKLAQAVRDILVTAQSAIQPGALAAALADYVQLAAGKIPISLLPEAALGAPMFEGLWDASTNTPAIPPAEAANRGFYYRVGVAGTTNIDGTSAWGIGDWIISDGAQWSKIDNSESVTSVGGKTGAVNLDASDVGLGNVDPNATANATDAELRNRALHTGTQPIASIEEVTEAGEAIATAESEAAQRQIMGLGAYRPAASAGETDRGIVPIFTLGDQIGIGVDLATNEFILGPLRVRYDEGELSVLRDGKIAFGIAPDGTVRGVAGAQWVEIGCTTTVIPGRAHSGPVYNVKFNGEVLAYFSEGIPFLVRPGPDDVPGHLAATQHVWLLEWDGQSWVLRANTLDEIRLTNPAMADRMQSFCNAMVCQMGSDSSAGFVLPFRSADYPGVMAYQRGDTIDRLTQAWPGNEAHLFRPVEVAAYQLDYLLKRHGMDRRALACWGTGWAGQSFPKFLDGTGPGITYPDGTGGTITLQPELVDGETEFLYQRNIVSRQDITTLMQTRYHQPRLSWPFKLWMQWPLPEDGAYLAALNQLRVEDDALGLPTPFGGPRWIIIDQMAVLHGTTDIGEGPQDQVDWAQANAEDRNVIAGARYPEELEDGTHHTSEGQVRIAEQYGLAMFNILLRGAHEPPWVKSIDRSQGANVVRYITNRPAHTEGGLIVDTDYLRDATTGDGTIVSGFSVRNEADGSFLGISGINTGLSNDGSEAFIDVTLDGPHTGLDLRCKYAGDGVAQPDGDPSIENYAPTTSGCVGNLRMDCPELGVFSQERLRQWLLACNKVIEA